MPRWTIIVKKQDSPKVIEHQNDESEFSKVSSLQGVDLKDKIFPGHS